MSDYHVSVHSEHHQPLNISSHVPVSVLRKGKCVPPVFAATCRRTENLLMTSHRVQLKVTGLLVRAHHHQRGNVMMLGQSIPRVIWSLLVHRSHVFGQTRLGAAAGCKVACHWCSDVGSSSPTRTMPEKTLLRFYKARTSGHIAMVERAGKNEWSTFFTSRFLQQLSSDSLRLIASLLITCFIC